MLKNYFQVVKIYGMQDQHSLAGQMFTAHVGAKKNIWSLKTGFRNIAGKLAAPIRYRILNNCIYLRIGHMISTFQTRMNLRVTSLTVISEQHKQHTTFSWWSSLQNACIDTVIVLLPHNLHDVTFLNSSMQQKPVYSDQMFFLCECLARETRICTTDNFSTADRSTVEASKIISLQIPPLAHHSLPSFPQHCCTLLSWTSAKTLRQWALYSETTPISPESCERETEVFQNQ